MSSTFQHQVRVGAVDRFDLKRQYRSYRSTFGRFDEVFGRDRVTLWKFDIGGFPVGCAVRDFCARLGIDLPPERIVRLNESLPRQVVALLFTYFKLGPADATRLGGRESQQLLDCLMPLGSTSFRLSPELTNPILERNHVDIAWMEARMQETLREDLGEHVYGDVRDEGDLLQPDPIISAKLVELLGNDAPEGVRGNTPEEVARLVHALRGIKVSDESRIAPTKTTSTSVSKGDLRPGMELRKAPRPISTYVREWGAAILQNLRAHLRIPSVRGTKKRY